MKKIIIHSVPRSGSTWLGEILNSHPQVKYCYQPLFSYAFKSSLTENSLKDEIDIFFKKLIDSDDDFINQIEERKQGKLPIFKKDKDPSHVVYKEVRYHHILKNLLEQDTSVKLIALIRNPLAVIHSWLNAPREFRKDLDWKELEEWRYAPSKNKNLPEEFNGFEKWAETVRLFEALKEEFPDRVKIVKYSELLQDTLSQVNELYDFCDLTLNIQTREFLKPETDTDEDSYSVKKQKIDDNAWEENLNSEIVKEIFSITNSYNLNHYL